MKHILLLTTGGTIASRPTDEGLAPEMDGEDLARRIPFLTDSYTVTVRDILHLDSSNIQPEEWQLIARAVYADRAGYDGIVVTHGTDTMAYTASMLSFMLRGIPIPVVLTGSQLPIEHPLTDALENLRIAFAMACSGAPAIRNAIFQATGVAIDQCPITPHVLFAAFQEAGLFEEVCK